MSIALSEFWANLVRAGVTDASGCKQIASQYSRTHDGSPVEDSVSLAKFMIQRDLLTEFQARALLSQPPLPIRFGGFLRLSDEAKRPLGNWIKVRRISDGQVGWLLRIDGAQMAEATRGWLTSNQSIAHESLQPIQCSVSDGSIVEVFSPLPDGKCLFDVIKKQTPIEPRKAVQIGITLAQALSMLHSSSIVHGAVRMDRVWLSSGRGKPALLREPVRLPAPGSQTQNPGWIDDLELPAAYAAPELTQVGRSCDHASDIYSLGCMLFRLVAGRMPFDDRAPELLVAAHVSETPPELSEAVSKGGAGDPCFRVIAFAMAKDPAARFASADQLADALKAVLPLLQARSSESGLNLVASTSNPTNKRGSSEGTRPSKQDVPTGARSAPERQTNSVKPAPIQAAPAQPAAPTQQETRRQQAVPVEQSASAKQATPPEAAAPMPPAPPIAAEKTPPEAPPPAGVAAGPIRSAAVAPAPPAAAPPLSVTIGQVRPTPISDSSHQPATVDDPGPADRAEDTRRPRVRRKKKKTPAPLILGGLGITALLLLVAVLVYEPSGPETTRRVRPTPAVIPRVGDGGVSASMSAASTDSGVEQPSSEETSKSQYSLVSDGRLLYVPPLDREAPNIPLSLLPPGPAALLSVRLHSIESSSSGFEMIRAMTPELKNLLQTVAQRSGVPLRNIERCTAAFHPGKSGWPDVSLAVELTESKPLSTLIQTWNVSASRTPEGATVYAGDEIDSDAYYLGGANGGSADNEANVLRFAVGSVARIRQVAELEGGEIPLPRALEQLWRVSSDQADLFFLTTPNFLFADGREMIQSIAPDLAGPLKSFLIPDVAAVQISSAIDNDALFTEMRMLPSGSLSDAALRERLEEAIDAWPRWADDFVVDAMPEPSWRLLANRLPAMMRFFAAHARFGISDSSAVTNAYLPTRAATQLTLATLLAVNTPRGTAVTTQATAPTKPLALDEMLDRKMSVAFDQESLEFAINTIAQEFQNSLPPGTPMPEMKIIGGDLQLMGITQNQQIRDFSKSDVPLRTVLTDLVVAANPDKSATGPTDVKQALIWVVKDDSESGGEPKILVTTRQAAKGKYELPSEFAAE